MTQSTIIEAALEIAQSNGDDHAVRSLRSEICKLHDETLTAELKSLQPAQLRLIALVAREHSWSGDLARLLLAKLKI